MELSELYQTMKTAYEEKTGDTIADDGDFGMRMQVVAGELAGLYQQADFVLQQMLPQTATGLYLERHAAIRGITRKAAGAAQGTVTFSAGAPAVQELEIPVGTMVTTSCGNGVVYATTETVVLAVGKQTVDAPVQAAITGKDTNLAAGGIDTLVSGVAGISGVTNAAALSGGCEEEDDAHLRARLLTSYLRPMNGANLRFYEELALQVPGVWSAQAVQSTASNHEIILYISNFFRDTPQSLCDQVAAALADSRELNVTLTVQAATPVVQNVSATVYLENLQGYASQKTLAETYLSNQLYLKGIGENLNPYSFAAGLSAELEGFEDVVFTNPTTLLSVANGKILEPGTVTVTLAKK